MTTITRPRFTIDEDNMIDEAWSTSNDKVARMTAIREYIYDNGLLDIPPIRKYAAYNRRYTMFIAPAIAPPTTQAFIGPAVAPPTTQAFIGPAVAPPTTQAFIGPAVAPPSNKRKADEDDDVVFVEKKQKVAAVTPSADLPSCPICTDDALNCVIASCGHVYCVQCYCSTLTRSMPNYTTRCQQCPLCRANWDKPALVKFMAANSSVGDCKAHGGFL